MKLILVGVSGFSKRWVKVFFESKKVTVAALVNHRADKFPEICKKYHFPMDRCYTSLKEALVQSDSQGVVVTIPTKYHYSYVEEALLEGKHLLVEKPFTLTLAESEKLVALAKKQGKLLSVVSQHRFAPYLKAIKEYCSRGGPLGSPLTFFVRIHMNRPESYYEPETRRTGHGVLAIQGVHPMDWIGWLFGDVKSCAAAIGTLFHKTQNEDNAYAMITMKSGVMGLFDINHLSRGRDILEFDVYFEKGVLRYSLSDGIVVEQGDKVKRIEFEKVDPHFDSLKEQLENFIGACRGEMKLAVTGEDGLRVMKLLYALYDSTENMVSVG